MGNYYNFYYTSPQNYQLKWYLEIAKPHSFHFRHLKLYLTNITSLLPAKILIETFEYYYSYYKQFISLQCSI
jgi:hypothetical protein